MSTHMLVGVLADPSGLCRAALSASGVSAARLRGVTECRDAERPTPHQEPPGTIWASECHELLRMAQRDASDRQQMRTDPGNLLIAIADSECDAQRVLIDLEADLQVLLAELAVALPTTGSDLEVLQRADEGRPRLSTEETRKLLVAVRTRSDDGAWLILFEHHRYLAWDPADRAASRGHRLEYAYFNALGALAAACIEATVTDGWPALAMMQIEARLSADAVGQ